MHHTTTIPERPQTHDQRNNRGRFSQLGMLIANDRVHLVPYCDQRQRASNISPAVTSVKSLRAFAFSCVASLTGSFVNR